MSLRKTLFTVALILWALLPAALLLKNQSPWTCFPITFDEGYFAQAASNWIEGKGFRTYGDAIPFDPKITVGVPMAWGAGFFRMVTGYDVARAGRVFVYATFVLLLLTIARSSFRRDRNWFAIPLSVGIFAYVLTKVPYGGYFAFGFLGETPAFLLAALAYRTLDERKAFRAGIYAAAAFLMKPTFVFFPVAVFLGAFLFAPRSAFRVALGGGLTAGVSWYLIADARDQSIFNYLADALGSARQVAAIGIQSGDFFDFYASASVPAQALSTAVFVLGGIGAIRMRRRLPSVTSAYLAIFLPALFYLILRTPPVEKHWWALFALSMIALATHWGAEIAYRFGGWTSRENVRALILAIVATWIFSVGQSALHQYKRAPETACASKEQAAINARIRELADRGEIRREDFGAWIEPHPYEMTLYRIGWNPTYHRHQQDLGPTLPGWVYAETKNVAALPRGCRFEFRGETFSLLRCEKKEAEKPKPVLPARQRRARS